MHDWRYNSDCEEYTQEHAYHSAKITLDHTVMGEENVYWIMWDKNHDDESGYSVSVEKAKKKVAQFAAEWADPSLQNAHERIRKALQVLTDYGQVDGSHHKMWVIDQAVRELTGCPTTTKTEKDSKGNDFTYEVLGESEEYQQLIGYYCQDGEYEWDTGIAPNLLHLFSPAGGKVVRR